MSSLRKAVSAFEEFDAMTLLKPFSDEYRNYLIVISEDAYGEFTSSLKSIEEIKKNFWGSDEEFQEMLKTLGI